MLSLGFANEPATRILLSDTVLKGYSVLSSSYYGMLLDGLAKPLTKDRHHDHAECMGPNLRLRKLQRVTLLNEHAAENGHGSLYRLLKERRENIRIDECLIKGG